MSMDEIPKVKGDMLPKKDYAPKKLYILFSRVKDTYEPMMPSRWVYHSKKEARESRAKKIKQDREVEIWEAKRIW